MDDYVNIGVANVWVTDAWKRLAYYASKRKFEQPTGGVLRVIGTPIEIGVAEVFTELDEH